MSHTPQITEDALVSRYHQLCEYRDNVYKQTAPLEERLENLNQLAIKHQQEAKVVADEIDKILGGQNWMALKKEISLIAKTLGRPNGPLASKE